MYFQIVFISNIQKLIKHNKIEKIQNAKNFTYKSKLRSLKYPKLFTETNKSMTVQLQEFLKVYS